MTKVIFNRKDDQVKKDATSLTLDDFLEKYKSKTTEVVLKSVYKDYNKNKALKQNTDNATDFPVVKEWKAEDNITVTVKKSGKTIIVETDAVSAKPEKKSAVKTSKHQQVVEKDEPEQKAQEVKKDKPGRTPRMRELIKELGVDKTKVKAKLIEEGFNTEGSGFHSEWNRLSKPNK